MDANREKVLRERALSIHGDPCPHPDGPEAKSDCAECILAALRQTAEEEFERLYGKLVNRASCDIAGDFDAVLDQIEYNARAEGERAGRKAEREEIAQLVEQL